jgi:hypothetical protein
VTITTNRLEVDGKDDSGRDWRRCVVLKGKHHEWIRYHDRCSGWGGVLSMGKVMEDLVEALFLLLIRVADVRLAADKPRRDNTQQNETCSRQMCEKLKRNKSGGYREAETYGDNKAGESIPLEWRLRYTPKRICEQKQDAHGFV